MKKTFLLIIVVFTIFNKASHSQDHQELINKEMKCDEVIFSDKNSSNFQDRNFIERQIYLSLNGYIPRNQNLKLKVNSTISGIIKTDKIKPNRFPQYIELEIAKYPDIIYPEDYLVFQLIKPHGYNISIENDTSNWLLPEVVDSVAMISLKDTVGIEIYEIAPFEFFYIDLTGFQDLSKIKELIRKKIILLQNDCFIYISNSSQPIIWESGENLDDLFTQISLMRPEPPFYTDEINYIQPYLQELIKKYHFERRNVNFHFLFNESFLNHSSMKFIDFCLYNIVDSDQLIKEGKMKITSYSEADNANYQKHKIHESKLNYKKL